MTPYTLVLKRMLDTNDCDFWKWVWIIMPFCKMCTFWLLQVQCWVWVYSVPWLSWKYHNASNRSLQKTRCLQMVHPKTNSQSKKCWVAKDSLSKRLIFSFHVTFLGCRPRSSQCWHKTEAMKETVPTLFRGPLHSTIHRSLRQLTQRSTD